MGHFLIVKQGIAQYCEQKSGWVLPIFAKYQEARAYANRNGATVAEIGSLEGETLDGHVALAASNGISAVLVSGSTMRPLVKA